MSEIARPVSEFTELAAAARRKTMEAEAFAAEAFASMRAALNRLEEENRLLRQAVDRKQVEVLTEAEFAKRVKVSKQTIATLRKAGIIEPLEIGGQYRYSSTKHLEHIDEIFTRRRRLHEVPRRASR